MSRRRDLVLRLIWNMFQFCLKSIATFLAALYVVWALGIFLTDPLRVLSSAGLVDLGATWLLGAACVAAATLLFAIPVAAFCATWAVFMIGTISLLERDRWTPAAPPVPPDLPGDAIEFLEDPDPPTEGVCLVCTGSVVSPSCPDSDSVSCPACEAPYHADCWEFVHGCARFACSRTPVPVIEASRSTGSAQPGRRRHRNWRVAPPLPVVD